MTPPRLDEGSLEQARKILSRLCDNGLLSMSIPVRKNDEDMVLSAVIEYAAAALSTGRLGGEMLILLSTGEYSDYGVMGAFRPVKSFNMGDVLEAFNAQWKPEEGAYTSEPGPNDFAAWLAKEGYIEDARTEEIHFGSYGELELSDESKALNFSAAPAAQPQGEKS